MLPQNKKRAWIAGLGALALLLTMPTMARKQADVQQNPKPSLSPALMPEPPPPKPAVESTTEETEEVSEEEATEAPAPQTAEPAAVAPPPPPAPAPAPVVPPPAPKVAAPAPPPPPPPPPAPRKNKLPVVAKLESAQLPAWVERDGVRASVKPGWAIYAGDKLITGAKGRAVLTLADDAQLRLGETATVKFALPAVNPVTAKAERVPCLFHVSAGAYDFSAAPAPRPGFALVKVCSGPKLNYTVLGGQVWGRSEKSQDTLVLVDGAAEVNGDLNGEMKLRLTQGETLIVQPAEGPLSDVAPVARDKFALWLSQTALDAKRPVLVAGGDWNVSLKPAKGKANQVEALACKLRDKGYPGEMLPFGLEGPRLTVQRFASEVDARRFVKEAAVFGAAGSWVVSSTP